MGACRSHACQPSAWHAPNSMRHPVVAAPTCACAHVYHACVCPLRTCGRRSSSSDSTPSTWGSAARRLSHAATRTHVRRCLRRMHGDCSGRDAGDATMRVHGWLMGHRLSRSKSSHAQRHAPVQHGSTLPTGAPQLIMGRAGCLSVASSDLQRRKCVQGQERETQPCVCVLLLCGGGGGVCVCVCVPPSGPGACKHVRECAVCVRARVRACVRTVQGPTVRAPPGHSQGPLATVPNNSGQSVGVNFKHQLSQRQR
jgi:hypothetical protein